MVVLHDCGSVVNTQNTRWRAWCIISNGKAHHASAATLSQAATKDIGAVSLDGQHWPVPISAVDHAERVRALA